MDEAACDDEALHAGTTDAGLHYSTNACEEYGLTYFLRTENPAKYVVQCHDDSDTPDNFRIENQYPVVYLGSVCLQSTRHVSGVRKSGHNTTCVQGEPMFKTGLSGAVQDSWVIS